MKIKLAEELVGLEKIDLLGGPIGAFSNNLNDLKLSFTNNLSDAEIVLVPHDLHLIAGIPEYINYLNKLSSKKPILISNYINDSTLYLSWIRRNFKIDMWHRDAKENLDFSIEIIAKDQVLNFTISSAINQMEIDISTLDISDGWKVDII